MRLRSGDVVATIPFDTIDSDFQRAELRIEGLVPPVRSFELRVFAEGFYLGSQYFYGLGVPDDPREPKDPFGRGRASQSAPTQIRLNITDGLRRFLLTRPPKIVQLTFEAVDRDGNAIPDPDLQFDGVSLVTT